MVKRIDLFFVPPISKKIKNYNNLKNKHNNISTIHNSSSVLELHIVRTITSLQGESFMKVFLEHGNLFNALDQSSIDSFLVGLAFFRNGGLFMNIHNLDKKRTT